MALRLSLFSIAAVLFGAHFDRAGQLFLVALCALALLPFLRRARGSVYL